MQTKFPYYLTPVHSNDEYSNEPTHCVIQVRPSLVLMIAWYGILARLVKCLSGKQPDMRFSFPIVSWLTLDEDKNTLEEEIIAEGGLADEDEIGVSLDVDEDGLRGYEIQIYNPNSFCFLCYQKHNGVEFFSDEIGMSELFKALRFEHVLAEIQYFVLRLKARATLRKLAA